jgi:hypothetical protein
VKSARKQLFFLKMILALFPSSFSPTETKNVLIISFKLHILRSAAHLQELADA